LRRQNFRNPQLQLTTKTKASKIVAEATTLAVTRIAATSDVDSLLKTLNDHVPASINVAK
jgi:hypothetical protein